MKAVQIVLLLLSVTTSLTDQNVARRGTASQSSHINFPYGYPQLAIDGNPNPNYDEGHCTATKTQKDPWWRLDLHQPYMIHAVKVVNRGDCCHERITGAQIHIGYSLKNNGNDNHLVATLPELTSGQHYMVNFTEVEGRFVNVLLPGDEKLLTLCEFEVYGHRAPTGENLALHGCATQSSTFSYGEASHAANGERNAEFTEESCQHTEKQADPWWRLDLHKGHKIESVNITNRLVHPERLDGAEIRIGDSLANHGNDNPKCATITHIGPGQTEGFDCHGMHGRYVNVVIHGRTEHLSMCEVEVYGALDD